jgi:hypothetical protein
MKPKIYHLDEMDTFEEVCKEMQKLRDEVLAGFKIIDENQAKISEHMSAATATIEQRIAVLERRLEVLLKKKAPPKKAKKK